MAKPDSVRANNQITSQSIILIDENGVKVGMISRTEALSIADSKNLDLIEISVQSDKNQSVCCLGDVNRYQYDKKKREKEQLRAQRKNIIDTKEIYLRPNTDTNDLNVKSKKALEFINNGDRVRVLMKFRNRENSHKEVGYETFNQFMTQINVDFVEKPIYSEGNNLVTILFKNK